MIDVATKRGIKIDYDKLMKKLKTPIFPVVARTGKGTNIYWRNKASREGYQPHFKINYGEKIEETIKNMCQIIMTSHDKYQARFIAIQFLLRNMQIANELNSEVVNKLSSLRDQVAKK